MKRSGNDHRESATICCEGRRFIVQSELYLNGRRYLKLDDLGFGGRKRTVVFDPATRMLRLVLTLPEAVSSRRHLNVLRRLPQFGSLPRILDVQQHRQECRVLVQWIRGIDLGQYLLRVKSNSVAPPSPYEAIRLVRGLAHGLLHLHQYAQIIHADIKPENLLITRKPSLLSLIDFGSAWPIESGNSNCDGDGMSPPYAAPELQISDSPIDARADQFSAAVVLYQLLTGEVPFDGLGGQSGKLCYRDDFADGPELPSDLSRSIQFLPRSMRNAIDNVLLRSLQFDRDSRFPTTAAWVAELDRITDALRRFIRDDDSDIGLWASFVQRLAKMLCMENTK